MHWQFWAYVKKYNDEFIREYDHTRRIMASMQGGDPRFIIPLPGDFENVPFQGTLNTEKLLKRAGLSKWLDG